MTDIEIPYEQDRKGHYRFFEILPGALSYTMLLMPLLLSFIIVPIAGRPTPLSVPFILVYLLIYFIRTSVAGPIRTISGYITHKKHMQLDWAALLDDVEQGELTGTDIERPKWHFENIVRTKTFDKLYKPSQLYQAVIIATVNESREVLEPTIQAVLANNYDPKKMILVFAYEGRAGKETKDRVHELLKVYGDKFYHAMAAEHPANIPGEVIGKGGNVSYAGRQLESWLAKEKIDPAYVVVTTLDADNRPDPQYFAGVSYLYCVAPDPLKVSYQPIPMFTNNIWDVPTLMRVVAVSNNLFYFVLTQRPHLQRNFSAHSQSMRALIDMDYWSVRTIVEDGHHFWRSYFHFDGDYRVYPLYIPIYQDAVLADGYLRTLKAQFVQLRRWTYGASDVAFIASKAFFTKNKVPKWDIFGKLLRSLEGHVTWATGTVLVFFAAFIPPLVQPELYGALILPDMVSSFQRVGILFLMASVYVSLVTLPPRPARYRRHRSVLMLLQWGLAPVTAIGYGATAAFYSQTRLMFGKYISKFDVTEKAVVTSSGHTVSTSADPSRKKKKLKKS
jgi:hypothetical protein